MPKMDTTLAKVIRGKQKLTDRHFQFFIYQILRGLKYIHSAGVIHCDLKPENILIDAHDCNVKINNFGSARCVCKNDEDDHDSELQKRTENVVSRWYHSPEILCSPGTYDEKVDTWSVGCIFAELILRRALFPGQNYLDQLKLIFEMLGTPKDLTWIKTRDAKGWVQKLKPHDGTDLTKLFENTTPNAFDLLTNMLILDPTKRITAADSLDHEYFGALHCLSKEIKCSRFDWNDQYEQTIKTKFGVRSEFY